MGAAPVEPRDDREPDPGARARCLGALEVRTGSHWCPFGGGKVRAVLAVLLVHAGEHVPVRQLIDEVWTVAAPPSAPSLVRGYVLTLRRTIGADGRALVPGHASGYRLAVPRSAIDAQRFEELATDGQAALRRGELDRAVRTLRHALALWRGPAFADVPRTPSVSAYAARLDELRLVALESRIEADVRARRPASSASSMLACFHDHVVHP
jgi:DNA-binding SARP family transcriptional activator